MPVVVGRFARRDDLARARDAPGRAPTQYVTPQTATPVRAASALRGGADLSAGGLALPSAKQLDFQIIHPKGCFFHFGINTFTGQEHGSGDPAKQPPKILACIRPEGPVFQPFQVKLHHCVGHDVSVLSSSFKDDGAQS